MSNALLCMQPGRHEAVVAQMDREVVEGPPLMVSVPGREGQLTVADVGNMPPQQFVALWQVNRKLLIPLPLMGTTCMHLAELFECLKIWV